MKCLLSCLSFSLLVGSAWGTTDSCVNEGVQIELVERFETGQGRQVYMDCSTNRSFFSTGVKIDFGVRISSGKIAIQLIGITGPKGSVGHASSKARARINLGNLPVNTYPIQWDVFGVINTSVLRVNPNSYIFREKEGKCISFGKDTVQKMPEFTIWGELYYASQPTNQVIWDFIKAMEKIGAKNRALPLGSYSGFEMSAVVNSIPPSSSNTSGTEAFYEYSFVMKYKGVDKKLQHAIDDFLEKHGALVDGDNLNLEVFGDSGFYYQTE